MTPCSHPPTHSRPQGPRSRSPSRDDKHASQCPWLTRPVHVSACPSVSLKVPPHGPLCHRSENCVVDRRSSSFCCRRWPPKKLKTTSGHACPLFSLQTQTCIARQQTIGEFNHLPPVAHSGPSIDRIGQLRVAAELLCCLGRPIHRRPPCAARLVHRDIPPCKTESASRPRQSQPRRRHQPGKPFSPGVFPIPAARQTGISPCPSRSCFHEAFHGSPQARLSFARPTEPSSRGGQAVWGTQPASAPLISDPSSPPSDPSLPVQASSSPSSPPNRHQAEPEHFPPNKTYSITSFPRPPPAPEFFGELWPISPSKPTRLLVLTSDCCVTQIGATRRPFPRSSLCLPPSQRLLGRSLAVEQASISA